MKFSMSVKEALRTLNIPASSTADDIKLAYRQSCSKYHPDRNPAGLEMMKLINQAYEVLQNYIPAADAKTTMDNNIDYGEALNNALNAIAQLSLDIEICGNWIWVGGDTKPHKDILKANGFKWANKKKLWNFRPAEWKSVSRGSLSMDEIRDKYGSQAYQKPTNNYKSLPA